MATNAQTRTIPAGEFKARCLALMDEVAASGETLIITKRGKPVARLLPPASPAIASGGQDESSVFNFMRGKAEIVGDITAPIYTEEEWEQMFEEKFADLTDLGKR